MNLSIPHKNIDGEILLSLYYKILNSLQSNSKLKLAMSDILSILNFPADVVKDINSKRQSLIFSEKKFSPMKVVARVTNDGEKVAQDLPGGLGFGIIIHPRFSCTIALEKLHQVITVDNIKGLDVDIPGPFNRGIDAVVIEARSKKITLSV